MRKNIQDLLFIKEDRYCVRQYLSFLYRKKLRTDDFVCPAQGKLYYFFSGGYVVWYV